MNTKPFKQEKVLRAAKRVVKKNLCNHCFGRQFAHVSTGMTNQERGQILRVLLKASEPKKCEICLDVFKKLEVFVAKAEKLLSKVEFTTFLVGSQSPSLVAREEALWEDVGIEFCEPIKSELNREVGKLLEKRLKKRADKNPDVLVMLDVDRKKVTLKLTSLFVYGKYKKLVRGIPQTKWATYKVTVEDLIAKKLMKASKAEEHAFHGMGREDIDARCLDWRPFVFELKIPKKRKLPLKALQANINKSKKIQVSGLRPSNKKEVIQIKEARPDKTYRVSIVFAQPVKSLAPLKTLRCTINQKTPSRVLHRRADLMRKRTVKTITGRLLSSKRAVLEVRGEAGLYIKELVTGDDGRTNPSVASVLGPVVVKELDVIKIWLRRVQD